MSSRLTAAFTHAMLLTGIILAPTIRADALSDLADLKTVINAAATSIGAQTNSSRNWGSWIPSLGAAGTADLLANITTSVLRANYNLGSNQTRWVNVNATGVVNATAAVNLTEIGLDDPYIEYVTTLPNLSAALTALGRSWHRELNRPVHEAIDGLQQTVQTFSSSLLQAGLIHSPATLRTIRASSSLEDAQVAWSRILNLPSPSGASAGSSLIGRRSLPPDSSSADNVPSRDTGEPSVATLVEITFEEAQEEIERSKRSQKATHRPVLFSGGRHFTHKDLWGREPEPVARQSREGEARPYDAVVQQEERVKVQARPWHG